ncbi:TonB-dependent receptor domain-containing protein [Mangrovimonas sp. YM274]|uniref:TonB-dependent receptor domain-containing protein n=1 Tax=Mangrovimonas sp. YM274 TaxID=3070660 RepID=UPI0027DAC813|nr:outer membrane beta-barrel family protein [Mangrovimonas sp. YM274]WMI68983.1 outer membrane beta-barrel family protein [Mangrovimonas sp. YM274]
MKLTPLINLLFLVTSLSFGQGVFIKGKVVDANNAPISYANVMIETNGSGEFVKGSATNDSGDFEITNLDMGAYILSVSFIGYKEIVKEINLSSNLDLGVMVMQEDLQSLEEINLTYKKPTVKKEADRLVFEVESTALTEGNMLQVIQSTPGVLVVDNSIMVKSMTPTVYINNRKVNLSSSELTQLLEGASATSIKSVEVITNPSAKYDAESGVVINIIMGKNLVTGYKGNVFGNFTQGVFPRYNGGMGHYFKTEKLNVSANYSYTQNKINRDSDEEINYFDNNQNVNQIWESSVNRNTWSKTHNLDVYLDYMLSKQSTLSLSANTLWMPDFEYNIKNTSEVFDTNESLMYYFDANNLSFDEKHNLGFNLDYLHLFNEEGEQLSGNAHYTTYGYARDQSVNSNYYDTNDQFLQATSYNTYSNQNTNIFTSQLDYAKGAPEVSSFETGLKFSSISTNSDITQFDVFEGEETLNPDNSDAFDYREYIYAGYVDFSNDWELWSLNFGLRVEKTNLKGISITNNETNKQDYLSWFPTTSINFKASDNLSLYTNYKRSIDRPDYQSLNPFKLYLNDNTVVVGNPKLQPVFIDHAVIGASFLDNYTVEAYYKVNKNNIYELPTQDNTNNILTYAPVNFDKTVEFGFDFVVNFYLSERWYLYAVTSFYNVQDEATFGSNTVILDQWSNYSELSNNWQFLKDKSLNANLNLIWVGKNLQGFRIVEDRLVSSLSISKTLCKKKLVLSLTAEDLFNMQDMEDATRFLNQYNSRYNDVDSRTIKVGLRYNFGNTTLTSESDTGKDLQELDRLGTQEN